MSISYQSALSQIKAAPAAVLFIDTCIFLDLIRAPVRGSINASTAKCANKLLGFGSNGSPVWLITSVTVQDEWKDNIECVAAEVDREILKLEQSRNHFLAAASATTGSQYSHGQSAQILNLGHGLKVLSERILNACMIVEPENSHMVEAMNRVKQYRPPAKRGKAEPKDCEIFEMFLHFCKDLCASNFQERLVFVSSNTNEYSKSNAGGIQIELDQYSAKYVSDLPWAFSEIGLSV